MSSESNKSKNPIEELIELLTEVNKAVCDMPSNEESETPPTSPEGFESLIPDSVMQKVQEVKKAVDSLNTEVLKMSASVLMKDHKDIYAQFQLVMFMDEHKDLLGAVGRLHSIHELDKPMIVEIAKEQETTPERLIHSFLARKAMEVMFER